MIRIPRWASVPVWARRALAGLGVLVLLLVAAFGTGDPGYLALLAQVHAATRAMGRLLSVAAEPAAGLGLAQPWLPYAHWWSPGYLHQVAVRSDEVAIMTYNSPMPTSGSYAGYVRWETRLALAAVPPDVRAGRSG